MNSKQLLYFLKLSETNSISATSRFFEIAQPSISLQLENLEHELGTVLFDRNNKGVHLTESGIAFVPHAKSILRQIDQSKIDIKNIESDLNGTIRIGMTQPIGNVISVPLLEKIKKHYPNVELDLYTGLSYNLKDQLKNGEIDFAIASPDVSEISDFSQSPLIKEKLFLISSSERKAKEFDNKSTLKLSDLHQKEIMVTSSKDSLGYILSKYEKENQIDIIHKPTYGQLMTTLQYVIDGHGVLICPSSAFFHLKKFNQVEAIEIEQPSLWRDVYIYSYLHRPSTTLMRKVKPLIYDVTKAESLNGNWIGELYQ